VRTEVRALSEQVRNKLRLPKAASTCDALGHHVAETVSEQEDALFGAQLPRSLAIEMDDPISVEGEGVVWCDGSITARALRFSHFSLAGSSGSRTITQSDDSSMLSHPAA